MKRAAVFFACALGAAWAVASCSSDDSSGTAPKCGGATGVPCIDGDLPDSDVFYYDAPEQYADVVVPDVNAPVKGADADADADADAGADAAAEADADAHAGADADADAAADADE
jgi:hypothetical protein